MKRTAHVAVGAAIMVALLHLAGCKPEVLSDRELVVFERLIRTYFTPSILVEKDKWRELRGDTLEMVVAVVVKRRINNYGNSSSEYLRISRFKGDTSYNQTLHSYELPATLAPDVKAVRIFEYQPDGTGGEVERDIGGNTRILYERLDDHLYHGFLNSGWMYSDEYGMEIRARAMDEPLGEFSGMRLPYFPYFGELNTQPLCTLRISPPPAAPSRLRIEVVMDTTAFNLQVDLK